MSLPVFITAVGSALPSRVLTNEQIVAGMPWLDTSADWIREHTGIQSRHVAEPDEHAVDLGLRAAHQALERAQVRAEHTDMVLMATNTAQFVYPAAGALLQERLADLGHAMPHAAALDVQQGCASFVAGIILAAGMIAGGSCRQILVVGADVATRMLDWTERSSVLLGDGATACVVSDRLPETRGDSPCLQILGSFMRTAPDRDSIYQRGVLDERNHPLQHMAFAAEFGQRIGKEHLTARLAEPRPEGQDQFFHMDGRKVYRFVRRTVPEPGFLEVLHRAGIVSGDELARLVPSEHSQQSQELLRADIGKRVDRFIPHGANMALNQELADQMHIAYERMALTLPEHGNTSAASVGIALDRILRGSTSYSTIAKRDGDGRLTRPSRQITVDRLQKGHLALLLSFGAGTSWNYIATRAV